MPRAPRYDAPGVIHHVIVRGIERRPIFLDDRDRAEFRRRLDYILPEGGTRCYAWAFIPNHVHLVLRTGHQPLPVTMARLGTGYAGYFNRRHGRAGHLFQNRYQSRRVENDAYLLVLVRYIHLNPPRSGLVPDIESLGRFPWAGHGALIGRRSVRFQDTGFILEHFGSSPQAAREGLERWMASSDEDAAPRAGKTLAQDLDRLVAGVCAYFGVDRADLLAGARGRARSQVRAMVAYLASRELALPQREIGRALAISGAAAAKAIGRGRDLAAVLPIAGLSRPPEGEGSRPAGALPGPAGADPL